MDILNEDFDTKEFDLGLRWFNEPQQWRVDTGCSALVIEPEAGTDFWRKTHYGFEEDSGHLLSAAISGDFVMMTKVRYFFRHQYDQAGLMVRAGAECWIKTSVEYEVDTPKLGVVVTNAGYSDWSLQDFDPAQNSIWLRIGKKGYDFIIEYSADGQAWKMLRIAHLDLGDPRQRRSLDCGAYACSPKGVGFRAEFELLQILDA